MPFTFRASLQFAAAVLLALLLAGCAGVDSDALSIRSAQDFKSSFEARPHIEPGDVLSVVVEGETDLSGDYTVGPEGSVALPLIADVAVVGLTPESAAKVISAEYRKGYLVDPVVRVSKKLPPAIFVMGEVLSPGSYAYQTDTTVMKSVSAAGGARPLADSSRLAIVREGYLIAASEETVVQAGDVVLVRARRGL